MASINAATLEDMARAHPARDGGTQLSRSTSSAVSWSAVAAGAAAAASLSLVLLILGVGLGLSSVSPWARDGISATTFGMSTIVWLTFTQVVASSMGGYLAGRLRTRWTELHPDEVYFRDTAHGFLAWALACLVTAALLTSVITSIVGGGVQAGATVVGGVTSAAGNAVGGTAMASRAAQGGDGGPIGYFIDTLFRRDATTVGNPAAAEAATTADAAEVSRIFMNVSRTEPLPADDTRYVGQIVARRTGLSQQDAEQRVTTVYGKAQATVRAAEVAARDATDKARKASAYGALWLFASLLMGAFVASFAATFGGRRRDA